MKPDYKNWVPKGMIYGFFGGALAALALLIVFAAALPGGALKTVLVIVAAVACVALACAGAAMLAWHRTYAYGGKRELSRQIIEGTAQYVNIPAGGKGLDVGCGSGALTIACAKRNRRAEMIGIDRWGKEYASFNKPLCEANARAEGVKNVSFAQGDANHLDFPDETFDAVTSNYVYHNIPSRDRTQLLRETLRVLKKGGTFAIHDIMSKSKYGDIEAFAAQLRAEGFQRVELIDTTQGKFMSPKEAKWMTLGGSTLLVGRK